MVTRHSFRYAIKGLGYVLAKERNARIHLLVAIMVFAVSIYFNMFMPELALSSEEFAALIFAIFLVFLSEIINTAIERTVDFFPRLGRPQDIDEAVGTIKDITAGAVLVSAVGASIIGIIVFAPRISRLIEIAT